MLKLLEVAAIVILAFAALYLLIVFSKALSRLLEKAAGKKDEERGIDEQKTD